ncbi:MAG TPA: hypothetical protein VG013_21220 [Gemmataceae bacterium]|jgi:hypothetical protein|nr:hypothetical protein [Gemmataceae bacterium]
MNCKVVQRHLLAAEDPESPPADVQYHLAVCLSCRQWQRRLAQIERHVPLLPVPLSAARTDLLGRILSGSARARASTVGATREERGWKKIVTALRLRSRPALSAAALAALVLLVLAGWALWGTRNPDGAVVPPPPSVLTDPLVAQLLDQDVRLAEAKTPRDRVTILADLADDLRAETHKLVGTADVADLRDLAEHYQLVVLQGVVKRAQGLRSLPARERRTVLDPITAQLARAERDAKALAVEVPAAAQPLEMIAKAAHAGGDQLSGLPRE